MRAPPPWVLPSATGLVFAVLCWWIPSYREAESAGREEWPSLVARAMGSARDSAKTEEGSRRRLTVIGVGSSLLTFATEHNWDMDRLAKEMGKRPLRYRKICAGGHKWDAMPLFEAACAARPDVVVIESNLLFLRAREDFEETEAEVYLDYLRWRIRVALGVGGPKLAKSWPFRILPGPTTDPDPRDITPAMIAKVQLGRARTFHPEDAANYVKVLKAAHEAGVTVVLLDLAFPSAPATWSPAQIRAIDDMHALLARETGAVVWRYPHELAPGDFWDMAHLSPQGRGKISRWFVEQMDALPIP
jgi:hypothetical protein